MPEPRVVKFGSGMARSTALTEARLRPLVSILAPDLRSPIKGCYLTEIVSTAGLAPSGRLESPQRLGRRLYRESARGSRMEKTASGGIDRKNCQ